MRREKARHVFDLVYFHTSRIAFCYVGLRHSLCHGWSSGVLAFLYEYMLGVKMLPGGKYQVEPYDLGKAEGVVPVPGGMLKVTTENGIVKENHCQ